MRRNPRRLKTANEVFIFITCIGFALIVYGVGALYMKKSMPAKSYLRFSGFLAILYEYGPYCLILIGSIYVGLAMLHFRKEKKKRLAELEQAEKQRKLVREMALSHAEIAADEFLSMESYEEFTGVYVLHNETKDMYYVGQSVRVVKRVQQHLTGRGNADIYADYKYGDSFKVRTIALANSGYMSIDDLERDMIDAYNAYNDGYNKTRGNGC